MVFRRGISPAHAQTLRKFNVPEGLISRMRAGLILTKNEEAFLHKKGWEYVRGFRKPGTKGVNGFIRKYRGNTAARSRAQRIATRAWSTGQRRR